MPETIGYSDLPETANQDLDQQYQKESQDSLIKHISSKIRAEHPDLFKDQPDIVVLKTAKQVNLPEATPEQFMQVAHKLYGQDWTPPPKPGLIPRGVAMAKDFGAGIINDITGIPKGLAETGQLVSDQLQQAKNTAFGVPPQENPQREQLQKQAGQHLARGGAFAAATAAASLTGGLTEAIPFLEGSAAKGLLGTIAKRSIHGAVGFGTFGGTYAGTKELATSGDLGKAFSTGVQGVIEGAKAGAIAGPVLGAVGDVGKTAKAALDKHITSDWFSGSPIERKPDGTWLYKDELGNERIHYPMTKAEAAGKALASAKTPVESEHAIMKFANAFHPDMVPRGIDPVTQATEIVKDFGGTDINPSIRNKAIGIIQKKLENPFLRTDVKEPALPELEPKIEEPKTRQEEIQQKINVIPTKKLDITGKEILQTGLSPEDNQKMLDLIDQLEKKLAPQEPSELSKEQRAKIRIERKKAERAAIEQSINDHLTAVHRAPRILGSNFKILDISNRPLEIVQDIAESPIYEALSGTLQDIHDAVVQKLVKYNKKYLNSKFWGIDISGGTHEAANIPGSYENSTKNLITVHPYNIWESVQNLLLEKKIPNSWDAINDAYAGQAVGAIIHELTHNIYRDEGTNFAYELTHNISRLANDLPELKKLLLEGMDENDNGLAKLIHNDYKRIKGSKGTPNVVSPVANPIRESATGTNKGSIKPSKETGTKSQGPLPTSVEDQAPRFPTSPNLGAPNGTSSRAHQLDPIHQEAARKLETSPAYRQQLEEMGGGRRISHAETVQKALESPAMTIEELSNWTPDKPVHPTDEVRAAILRTHLWNTYWDAITSGFTEGAEHVKSLFLKTEAGYHNLTGTPGRALEIQKVFSAGENIVKRTTELWDQNIPPSQMAAKLEAIRAEEEAKVNPNTPEKKSMLRTIETYSVFAKLETVALPPLKFLTDSFFYAFRGVSKTLSAGILKVQGYDAEALANLKFAFGVKEGFRNGFKAFKQVYLDDTPAGTILDGDITSFKRIYGSPRLAKKLRPVNVLSALQAVTNAWHAVSYHSEMATKVYTQALSEGITNPEQLMERFRFLMEHPNKEWHFEADEVAKKLTGQEDPDALLKVIQKIQNLPFMRLIMPVVKFPYNVSKMASRSSPLGLAFSGEVKENLFAKEPLRRADEIGRQLTGIFLTGVGLTLANNFEMYGAFPHNPKERQHWKDNNIQPWSIRIGKYFIKFDKTQPLGTFLQHITAIKTAIVNDKYDEASTMSQKLIYQYAHGGFDLPFLGSIEDLSQALEDPHANLENFKRLLVTGFFPNVLRDIRNQIDPVVRKPSNLQEAIENMIPGLSERVPADITTSGKPRMQVENRLLRASKQVFTATPTSPELELKNKLAWEPPDVERKLKYQDKEFELKGKQKEQYFIEMNKAADQVVHEAIDIFQQPQFTNLSDEQKRKLLNNVVQKAQEPIRMKYKALVGLGGPEVQAKEQAKQTQ